MCSISRRKIEKEKAKAFFNSGNEYYKQIQDNKELSDLENKEKDLFDNAVADGLEDDKDV